MSNVPVATTSNILVGSARLLVAPLGTALPTVSSAGVLTWPAVWKEQGATEKGTDLTYTPSFTDLNIDEAASPVGAVLKSEKTVVSCSLAEVTMNNLSTAVSASTSTTVEAGASVAGTTELDAGGAPVVYHMVGLEGVSPAGLPRYFVGYKAMATAAVKLAFQRATPTNIPLSLSLMADLTKPAGQQLFKIVNIDAAGE
jgi:hypothetical protein